MMQIRWVASWALFWAVLFPAAAEDHEFAKLCAACHGVDASGTDRGPALKNNRRLRGRSESEILSLIRNGTPGGMPPFPLTQERLQPLARFVRSLNASAYDIQPAGDIAAGERFFFGKGQCGACHM